MKQTLRIAGFALLLVLPLSLHAQVASSVIHQTTVVKVAKGSKHKLTTKRKTVITHKVVTKHKVLKHKRHVVKVVSNAKPISPIHIPPPSSMGEEMNHDWYLQRAWPNRTIDPMAYPNALAEARALPVWGGYDGQNSFQSVMQWQLIGPTGIGGRVSAMAADPADSNTIYAGAAAGGVWKTSDHGATWNCITDTLAALPTGALAVDPQHHETIYLGQGESDFSGDSYPGNGMWKSIDGGTTWTSIGLTNTQYIARIVIDPTNTNIIYVAVPGSPTTSDTNRGVYKSTNGGTTWKQSLSRVSTVKNAITMPVVDIAMNPLNHGELAAFALDEDSAGYVISGGKNTGLWHSTDSGATWRRIDTLANGFPNGAKLGTLSRGALTWADSSGTAVLFAAVSIAQKDPVTHYRIDVNFLGLYRSTNPDSAWTSLQDSSSVFIPYGFIAPDTANILYRQGEYNFYLAQNPANPGELYIGGIDVLRSTNWGRSFTDITSAYPRYFNDDRSQHSDQHALVFTPSKQGNDLFLGSDGGVFHTADFGNSWAQIKGLPITMFYAIEPWWPALDHANGPLQASDLKVFGGTQDNGTVAHGFTSNSDWDWINRGDGAVALSNPNDSSKLFTSAQNGTLYYRVSLDSIKPNLAYDLTAATDTINYHTQWHQFSVDLLKGPGRLTDSTEPVAFVAPLALDNMTGNDLYTGRLHVYHATIDYPNKAVTWKLWSPILAGLLDSASVWYYGELSTIALGPHDASGRPMIWAGGIATNKINNVIYSQECLWRTTVNPSLSLDSAPVWISVTSGFPQNAFSTIALDRYDSLTAFAGFSGYSAGHIYKTTNGGKNWKSISGNLPNAPVTALLIDTLAEGGNPQFRDSCLIAATDVGVYVTTNQGKAWSKLGVGLPNCVIDDIKLYKNWLLAGTDGRSAWALDMSPVQVSASVASAASPVLEPRISSVWPNPFSGNGQGIRAAIEGDFSKMQDVQFDLVEVATGKSITLLKKDFLTSITVDLPVPDGLSSGGYLLRMQTGNQGTATAHLNIVR